MALFLFLFVCLFVCLFTLYAWYVSVLLWYHRHFTITDYRGVRGIFFRGDKVIFPDFFPGEKCFFPVENSHFGRPKANFSGFQKWNVDFPSLKLHFAFFFFQYLFFPSKSAEISLSKVSGALCPLHPTHPPHVKPLTDD